MLHISFFTALLCTRDSLLCVDSVVPGPPEGNSNKFENERNCPCQPLCVRPSGYSKPVCWTLPALRSRYASSNENIGDVHTCLYALFQQIHGQKSSIETIVGHINRKLYDPKASFIVHLAGDNGVGKTMSASILSTAISLFPHQSAPSAGETLLIFPGSEFASIAKSAPSSFQQAAEGIRARLVAHATRFPRCVVLFDEITQFHPALMEALNPVFAAIEHGGSLDGISMVGVFCFITSDFGSNGRTLGMTPSAVRTIVWDIIQETYPNIPVFKKANIVPFLSLGPADFQSAIRYRLETLKCHHQRKKSVFGNAVIQVREFQYDADALVEFLYAKILNGIPQRNGREIDRIFDDFIEGPLILKLAEYEIQETQMSKGIDFRNQQPSLLASLWPRTTEIHVFVSFQVQLENQSKSSDGRLTIDVKKVKDL